MSDWKQHLRVRQKSIVRLPKKKEEKNRRNTLSIKKDHVIVVLSRHSWHKDKFLSLVVGANGKLKTWALNNLDSKDMTLEEQLSTVFLWTGLGPETLLVTGGTVDDVYRFLYALPIPGPVRFVRLFRCLCHYISPTRDTRLSCLTIQRVELKPIVRTFGEAFALWGDQVGDYWELRDGCYFVLKPWDGVVVVDGACVQKASNVQEPTNCPKNTAFYQFYFSR